MRRIFAAARSATSIFRMHPGFALAAVGALALGIGANGLVFSLVDAVALRPLPFDEPDRLVAVWESNPAEGIERIGSSPPNFRDWQRSAEHLSPLATYVAGGAVLVDGELAEKIPAAGVSLELFDVLGRQPVIGRTFRKEEMEPGGGQVVILGHELWQSRFGGDPDVLGRELRTAAGAHRVVGVMPEGFDFPAGSRAWTPLTLLASADEGMRGARFMPVIGRLAPGATLESARREMAVITERLAAEHPVDRGFGAVVSPLREELLGDTTPAMLVLLAAVGFVALIICANVSTMLLARSSMRLEEVGVRTALGATRGDVLRAFLGESLVLASLGGALGLGLVAAGSKTLLAVAPEGLPRIDQVGIDLRVVGFTVGMTLLSGLLAGLAPALHGSRLDPARLLGSASGTSGGADGLFGSRRMQRVLTAGAVAVTGTLLICSGALLEGFLDLARTDPGFRTGGVLTARISLSGSRYATPESQQRFFEQLLDLLREQEGVAGVGAVTNLPLGGTDMVFEVSAEGAVAHRPEEGPVRTGYRAASPGYFRTLGIDLLAGRAFTERDRRGGKAVAVVNRALAERLWPGGGAVGERLSVVYDGVEREVVGIVGDVRHGGLGEAPRPEVYVPFTQNPWSFMNVVLRGEGESAGLPAVLRGAVGRLDPRQPVDEMVTMERLVSASVAQPRFYSLAVLLFAVVGLASAAVGIAGLVSFTVARRVREIGIRISLGAGRGRVLGTILREVATITAAGGLAGVAGALALAPILRSRIAAVEAPGPAAVALPILLLLVTVFFAGYWPARRATRLDPVEALRVR